LLRCISSYRPTPSSISRCSWSRTEHSVRLLPFRKVDKEAMGKWAQVHRLRNCSSDGSYIPRTQPYPLCQHNPSRHQAWYLTIHVDNILLPNEDRLIGLKIADFGLSTKLDFHYPKTATSKCGTMLYMAPEILCNYTYTKAVDVWSCAIIMHLLGHGRHPLY
jgi:hypothetical protein